MRDAKKKCRKKKFLQIDYQQHLTINGVQQSYGSYFNTVNPGTYTIVAGGSVNMGVYMRIKVDGTQIFYETTQGTSGKSITYTLTL